MNSMFKKNNDIFEQALRRVALLYISGNLFNAMLYRKQILTLVLPSVLCDVTCHVTSGKLCCAPVRD